MTTRTVGDHQNCCELTSGKFTIAVTTEVGPRVIYGSIDGSDNIFAVLPPTDHPLVKTGWRNYGGHRLWHSPEAAPRTYAADNDPVEVTENEDGSVTFSSGVEALTGIEKSITIEPLGNEQFVLAHRLVNRGQWDIEVAAWALSVMAPGGLAVVPFAADRDANPYAMDRTLNLWPYSDFTDPRLTLGERYLTLRQDPAAEGPCKIGVNAAAGWVGYVVHNVALVKQIEYAPELVYPDNGCNVESYTCADFCEIESLGPMCLLAPGEDTVHIEVWNGLPRVGTVGSEDEIDEAIAGRLG